VIQRRPATGKEICQSVDAEAARLQWRRVADQLRPNLPKLAGFLDAAENDVLAHMTFPAAHRARYMILESVGALSDGPLVRMPRLTDPTHPRSR
jgi:transposase-like protein